MRAPVIDDHRAQAGHLANSGEGRVTHQMRIETGRCIEGAAHPHRAEAEAIGRGPRSAYDAQSDTLDVWP